MARIVRVQTNVRTPVLRRKRLNDNYLIFKHFASMFLTVFYGV
jgi:hypothetical protein